MFWLKPSRKTRIKQKLKKFSEENNIILKDNKYSWFNENEHCSIIDIGIDNNINYNSFFHRIAYEIKHDYNLIILTDLDKDNLSNIKNILNSFKDNDLIKFDDEKPHIKIYNNNKNLKINMNTILENLADICVSYNNFYGPCHKKFTFKLQEYFENSDEPIKTFVNPINKNGFKPNALPFLMVIIIIIPIIVFYYL